MTLLAPRDENQLRHMLKAALGYGGPAAIRFPKGEVVGVPLDPAWREIPLGKAETLKEGDDLVLAYGSPVYPALEAARRVEAETAAAGDRSLRLAVVDAMFAKPLDEELILAYARAGRSILTVEEGVLAGGFGSAVRELLGRHELHGVRVKCLGLPIDIVPVGKMAQLRKRYGLDVDGLAAQFRAFFVRKADQTETGSGA
jgi:1-deoxy-D-xylulose-5-phosphate synthase